MPYACMYACEEIVWYGSYVVKFAILDWYAHTLLRRLYDAEDFIGFVETPNYRRRYMVSTQLHYGLSMGAYGAILFCANPGWRVPGTGRAQVECRTGCGARLTMPQLRVRWATTRPIL